MKPFSVTLCFLSIVLGISAGVELETAVATVSAGPVPDYDVVIVGAGLSGLWTANQLQKEMNATVLLVEARERVGGRTFTKKFGNDWIDLGGQWVGTPQHQIMKVIELLGLKTFNQPIAGKKILDMNGKVSHYKSTIPSLSILKTLDLGAFMLKAEHLRKSVPTYCPDEMKDALKYDGMTVSDMLSRFPWVQDVKDLIDVTTRVVYGKDADELSVLYFLQYVACGEGILPLLDSTKGGAQEFKVEGGTMQISEKLARGLDIKFNEPVFAITQDASMVTVRTASSSYTARQVVMTTPPHLTSKITFNPPFNPIKDHLYQRMTQGHLLKVIFTYPTAFWKTNGFSGEVVATQELDVCYDDTYPGQKPALLCFVGGSWSSKVTMLTENQRKTRFVELLTGYFGDEAASYDDYIEQDWGKEPYTGGCPAGSMNAGTITQYGSELRRPHGKVYFAGTEMATRWFGFMNGAIQSGQRATIEIMKDNKKEVPQEMIDFLHLGEHNGPDMCKNPQ